tara:strand:+ start:2698 stop:3120 length:423 start_codon:yes stop_codon:yes gene_type:complete
MSKKLKWEKIYKKQSNLYGGYYALSPISNQVYIISKGTNGWSHFIIYKKHLKFIKDITSPLLAEDIYNKNHQQVLDCWSHTLKAGKFEFQKYVDLISKKTDYINFYDLKDYLQEIKKLSDNATSSSSSDKSNNKANSETR